MYILLFLFWIILNGRITWEIVILGLIFSAIVYALAWKFWDYSPKRELAAVKLSGYILQYILVLLWEILKANISVIGVILSVKTVNEPSLVSFKTNLKSTLARVVLANSITLTPGTITVSLEEDEYVVHCLDREFGEGIDSSIFVQMLERMEKVAGVVTEKSGKTRNPKNSKKSKKGGRKR